MKLFPQPFRYFATLFFLPFCSAWSQEEFPVLWEPEVEIKVKTEGPWSYDFGVSHRNLIYSEDFVFEEIQLELAQTTSYSLNDRNKIGVGIKYRFKELFEESAHNEFRFLQQYSHTKKYGSVKTGHRFRFEQRFREHTTFRARYRFSVSVPLTNSEENERPWHFAGHAEILWSITKANRPSLDQRIGIGLEKEIWENTELGFGTEYRHENYTENPENELFITTGISISL